MLTLVTALAPVGSVAADPLDDKQRSAQQRADAAQRQYEQLQESVEELSADLAQAVLTLEETKARLPAAQAALDAATIQADAARRTAALAQSRLEDTESLRKTLQDELDTDAARREEVRSTIAQLARSAYQGSGSTATLEVAVGAASLEDFVDRAETVATAQRLQSRALEELVALEANARSGQARLAAVITTLAEMEAAAEVEAEAAEAARAEQQTQTVALQQAIADQSAAAQRIEGMRGQAQAEQAAADSIRAAAEAEIAQIAAQEEAAARQQAPADSVRPAPNPAPGQAAPPAAPPASSSVLFSNPTSIQPMYVTSNYGMRLHPILGYYRLHAGIDLRTYCNTPLYAPRDGTVQWSEWRNGFGNQVMLNYGTVNGQSLMSSSNHLTRSVVSSGQQVSRGQLIGYSGNTGLSGACHLHFEVYVGGKTVDPAPLLGLR
ncbi:peptidoglycan DD-metalloendopeptidase family protein [Cellulomonas hominis]|uniref:peptidoglycan DD-metalloendopeptidase family protein n=1 Tax=Cellulomonas hominis TaxID=156981 RepID=UPI001444128A|nr:peptidoglycan DD-metalloendopeptidase family protein [Cellulomonas hominis]